jgi:hypothetical protein
MCHAWIYAIDVAVPGGLGTSLYDPRVSLHGLMVSLHGIKVSLHPHGEPPWPHGEPPWFRVSLLCLRVSVHGQCQW